MSTEQKIAEFELEGADGEDSLPLSVWIEDGWVRLDVDGEHALSLNVTAARNLATALNMAIVKAIPAPPGFKRRG